jgi:hypothetical protein
MKLTWFDETLVTMNNMRRMARRRGKRDGRAEKPAANSPKNSVPFLSQAHAHFSAEGERRVSGTRKLLNERIYETLERNEQIILLESQIKKVSQSLIEEELRVKHFKDELDGYKEENTMGKFARTQLIPDALYWFVMLILVSGEILVTAPALIQLFGEGKWQSWVIAVAIGFLPVAGAHLIGTFLKSRLDRQRPQENWVRTIYIVVFLLLVIAIGVLGVLRAGITEGELQDFTLVPEEYIPEFLVLFFISIQLAFFTVAIGLGFLHHSPAAKSLKEARKEVKRLKTEEIAIQAPLSKYKSKNGLTVDEIDARLRSLKSEMEILRKEHDVAAAIYREANVHARRDEMDGSHVALQASELEVNLDRFEDIFASIRGSKS